jgi:hypothetical protein
MKKRLLLLSLFAAAVACAQAAPRQSYHEYRLAATEPTYGLAKVKRLASKIKIDSEDNHRMSDEQYNSLSFKEKFTYTMVHGEDMSQNCDAMPTIVGEDKKIFPFPPGAFNDEARWSERQTKFLHNNRKQVIGLIRSTIRQKQRVGVNLKQAIVEINAYELIPDLISIYSRSRKDHDILTVLMLLMKEGKYKPFLASSTFTKFYGENANYQAYSEANRANQKLVISRAMGFYRQKTG